MYSEICFDIAAIFILVTLLISLLMRKLTKGRTNKLFLTFIVVTIISGITDMLTEMFGSFIPVSEYNFFLQKVLNYLFFLSRDISTPLYILYLCSVIGIWHIISEKTHIKLIIIIPFVIDVLFLILNPFTRWVFYFDENMIYQRGNLIFILYVIAFLYIIVGLFVGWHFRRVIESYKMVILLSFTPIGALAIAVQMIFPQIRVEIFMSALTMLAIAIGVQRPEEMINAEVNTLSYKALLSDVTKAFATNMSIDVLFVKITNNSALRNHIGLDAYLKVISMVADKIQRMSRFMKASSDVYYLEGGAFAVVNSAEHSEEIIDIGRIIYAFMQEPLRIDNMEVMVNTRIAYARCPEDIESVERFVNFAHNFHEILPDRGRVIKLSDYMNLSSFQIGSNIDKIINEAIINNRFEMYYQPIYSIHTGKFISAEALIRLNDPHFGLVSPGIFIPSAEKSGAIHQIGDYVLKSVFRFISDNHIYDLGLEYIEINLSVAQCIEKNLVGKVRGYIRQSGVKPGQINFEITETAADYDRVMTDANIAALSQCGIGFSLDDYGTGYSNIKRVVSMPLDIVKIDKSMVDEMNNPDMWVVIKNTVSMLKKLNKKILVEGVETKEALDKFTELDCDYIQGFYFSKALCEADFIDFIKSRNLEAKTSFEIGGSETGGKP